MLGGALCSIMSGWFGVLTCYQARLLCWVLFFFGFFFWGAFFFRWANKVKYIFLKLVWRARAVSSETLVVLWTGVCTVARVMCASIGGRGE